MNPEPGDSPGSVRCLLHRVVVYFAMVPPLKRSQDGAHAMAILSGDVQQPGSLLTSKLYPPTRSEITARR